MTDTFNPCTRDQKTGGSLPQLIGPGPSGGHRMKRRQDIQCGGHAFSFSTGEAEAASQRGVYGKTQVSQGDKVRPRALLPTKDG